MLSPITEDSMAVQFYNTRSRSLQEFQPQVPGKVSLYICGPTVYNYMHIGNLRTFLFGDLLKRWLEYRRYEVTHVMNITDVDDKTIRDSIAAQKTLKEFTTIYKEAFLEDLRSLNIKPATYYPLATDSIEGMIDLISRLMEKGHAYATDDGVYFRVSSFDSYGKLAHLDKENLKTGASGRVAQDEYDREDISDFALWKKWVPGDGDVKWDSPWGAGRPGWHIECSVMSMKYLGETLDIHAGGVDLIFPHHENEIAQSEAVTGKEFARYWLHAAHLVVDGQKMSKSKGNFFTLRDIQDKGFDARALRFALFTTHYRKPLNFTLDGLRAAESALERLDDFILNQKNNKNTVVPDPEMKAFLEERKNRFEQSMDEDINIAEAMGSVFEIVKYFNERLNEVSLEISRSILDFFRKIDQVLGFLNMDEEDSLSPEDQGLLDQRAQARKDKDWIKSDEIRDLLLERGVEVRDSAQGQVWKRVK